ncbi:YueI family protein [Desemzia sp. RIT804]|uniref:YueI family protein n=1 Tax=Desemzia sp. RIT 804 TaxID=2810209 RepID=UPI0019523427|nr:DUF1694 domain-containing protein [Desemzia sp. RIT 804]MBM6613522.1 YueI family protein [Desemzia sp. RIT 804]
MVNKDPNDYLQKGQYGTKQTLLSERKEFLGSLRERIYLTATLDQLSTGNTLAAFTKEFQRHPDGSLLLNGALDMSQFQPFIQASKKANIPFTLVANEYAQTCPYALVFTASSDVNESIIDVTEKYPLPKKDEPQQTKQKKSFFKRFFS